MALAHLNVMGVRNLRQVVLEPDPGINILYGPNASGKTSLLEAIHILGRGSSFRSRDFKKVIQFGQEFFRISAHLAENHLPIGLEYGRQGLLMRVGGKPARSRADLMQVLPLVTMTPESHRLLSEGPRWRRRMVDWGVFHVEPTFLPAWRRYQRAMKQRNAALRMKNGQLASVWDQELVPSGLELDLHRKTYLARLRPYLADYGRHLIDIDALLTDYYPGWKRNQEYAEALAASLSQDLEHGYTRYGPHRADVILCVEGRQARDVVSRGQQKLLIAAMLLAQVSLVNEASDPKCMVLIDDLPAELDSEHRHRFLSLLNSLEVQAFITATDINAVAHYPSTTAPPCVFHVEHGQLSKQ